MRYASLIFIVALAACGDSATAPEAPPTYESIAGRYVGSLYGETDGFGIEVDYILSIAQNGGQLTGVEESYTAFRDLSTGLLVFGQEGEANFTGTIGTGSTPAVTFKAATPVCGDWGGASGIFDAANNKITVSGSLNFYDDDPMCELLFSMPYTLFLIP